MIALNSASDIKFKESEMIGKRHVAISGVTFGQVTLEATVIGAHLVFEGDIMLGRADIEQAEPKQNHCCMKLIASRHLFDSVFLVPRWLVGIQVKWLAAWLSPILASVGRRR